MMIKSNKRILPIAILALVVGVGLAFGAIFLFGGSDEAGMYEFYVTVQPVGGEPSRFFVNSKAGAEEAKRLFRESVQDMLDAQSGPPPEGDPQLVGEISFSKSENKSDRYTPWVIYRNSAGSSREYAIYRRVAPQRVEKQYDIPAAQLVEHVAGEIVHQMQAQDEYAAKHPNGKRR